MVAHGHVNRRPAPVADSTGLPGRRGILTLGGAAETGARDRAEGERGEGRMPGAPEFQENNPLRAYLPRTRVPEPCIVVLFGATGDLAHRKLAPALYHLALDG